MALLGSVAALALLAGIAITGLPDAVPSDVVSSEIAPAPTKARRTVVATSVPATVTSSSSPTTTTASTPTTAVSISDPSSTLPASTIGPTTSTMLPVEVTRIVIANAGPADLLAARTAEVVRSFGYVDVAAATALERRALSAVLFAPGREAEARHLAGQLAIPDAQVEAHPQVQLTDGDE